MAFNFGSLLGGPVGGLAAGVLGGLFGGKPHMDPNQQRLLNQQNQIIGKELNYANGVPLSDPQEQAALAQQRGLLGSEQVQGRNDLFNQYNPTTDSGNRGDMLANLTNNQIGQRSSLDAQALLNSLQMRRQALQTATGMIGTASGIAGQPKENPNGDLPGLFGQLFQTIAYANARKKPNAATDNPLAAMFGGAPAGGPAPGGLQMPGMMNGVGTGGHTGGLQMPHGGGGALTTGTYGGTPGANLFSPHDQGMWNLGQQMAGGK